MTENKLQNIVYTHVTQISDLEEENKFLKDSLESLEKELQKYKKTPLIACEIRDIIEDKALVRLPNGNEFLVDVSTNCESPLLPGESVLAEQKNLTIVKKVKSKKNFDVEKFVIIEKPKTSWDVVGGLEQQRIEIQEVIELPLKKPELFKKVGIEPPKGILLHGPPGTGKTLLAKAVAASTDSTFIEVVASELVQKFIGEGAKLVKEIFQLAREKAPSIIFIDELDAIAATRIELGTSGEREVQRTFMQLLAEIDGFKALGNVKIIGCTNRKDVLDPAIVRPGRLDRLIQVPLPNEEARKEILNIHSKNLTMLKVDLDKINKLMEEFSGAEIKSTVTEAGYFAIRSKRTKVTEKDFMSAIDKIKEEDLTESREHLEMFG